MAKLPSNIPGMRLRSFYGFGPEEDGYIGWTEEAPRDRMLRQISDGDIFLIYGAGSKQTAASYRNKVIGFLQVELRAIMDHEKSSSAGLERKRDNGWQDKWSYAIPVKRAWRVDEPILLEMIAPLTYRPEAGQAIAVWSPALESSEIERALKIKVTEVNVYGEPPVAEDVLSKEPLLNAFKPSRAFPGSSGERTSVYEDGNTFVYLARFDGDGHALIGKPKPFGDKSVAMKVGISNAPKRRLDELNSGIPPAAKGKWSLQLISQAFPDRQAAETVEQAFKDDGANKLESLGKEFFWGDWTAALLVFSSLPGMSRF